jgi:uncharacterized iron-regulated membrane protein
MSFRKLIFWTHLAVGVAAGVVIFVMSLTGALLAFGPQLTAWAERDFRQATPPAPAAALSVDALLAAAQTANPAGRPTAVTFRPEPAATVVVNFGRENGSVYLNPFTGAVVGHTTSLQKTLQQVEQWHRWLGSRTMGKPVADAANLLFCFLAISGLYLWWPRRWNWAALRPIVWFAGGLRGRARDWNWHNVIGLWSAPVLVVLTLSGVIMSYSWANHLLFKLAGSPPPPVRTEGEGPANSPRETTPVQGERKSREPRDSVGNVAESHRVSLDLVRATVAAEFPHWQSLTLRLPTRPGGPVICSVVEPAGWNPTPRASITLDSATGNILKCERYADQSLGRRWRTWVRILHTGEAGRWPGQLVAALASLGGCVLVWTGLALAWRRFGQWKAKLNS